jgi:hypothetical protein
VRSDVVHRCVEAGLARTERLLRPDEVGLRVTLTRSGEKALAKASKVEKPG